MLRSTTDWIDDEVEDQEDTLAKSERNMKILYWHVGGVR